MYDSLDGGGVMEYWDFVRVPSGKERCEGCKLFGEAVRVPLLR